MARRSERSWHIPKPSIIWDVKKRVKAGDPPEIVRPVVKEILYRRFNNSTILYTDGSKNDDTVGAGIFGNGIARSISLPGQCSVFSAEAFAIKTAVNIPNISNEVVIVTDSASCLMALETGKSKHPWIQEIETITRNRIIHFCWIPGHAGVIGNVEADRLANEARSHTPATVDIPAADALRSTKNHLRQHWNNCWFANHEAKLREIKPDTLRWRDRANTADQRTLTRLRIGHTRLTHTFLLKRESPPICEACGIRIDVRHVILHCRKYEEERQKHEIATTSLRAALNNNDDNEEKMLQFLKDTGLYSQL